MLALACCLARSRISISSSLRASPTNWLARSCFQAAREQTAQVQRTLGKPVSRRGIGLHSGEDAVLRLMPAPAGKGRFFACRNGKEEIVPVLMSSVKSTTLSTCLGGGAAIVRTVEHLLSALEGLGVDNCRIEIEGGNEVPILDGSAMPWVEAIEEAGLCAAVNDAGNEVPRKAIVIHKRLQVSNGGSFVAAFPSQQSRITYGIEFAQVPAIGSQWFSFNLCDALAFKVDLAPARTFGIFEQIEELQNAGLIKGGSLDNALVCSLEKGWLNPPLRFLNEPCRHKLLDLIGDLAVCAQNGNPGVPVAHIVAFKASHALHLMFGKALLEII